MLASWPRTKGSVARRLQLVSPPTAEVISTTLEQSTWKVAVNTSAYDISQRVATARRIVEGHINRKLVCQVWDMFLDDEAYVSQDSGWLGLGFVDWQYSDVNLSMPEIVLPFPPVRAVLGVYVTDPNGNESLVDPSVYYVTNGREPCRIRLQNGQVWPFHRGSEAFRIRFACGYAAPIEVAEDGMTLQCQNHGYVDGQTVYFSSTDGTLPNPIEWAQSYTVVNPTLSANTFQICNLDGSPLSGPLDSNWPGVAFAGAVPEPLVQAIAMISALEKGGQMPPRMLAGQSRMETISLPIDPYELISEFVWPAL